MVQTPVVCGSSILREVAASVMITSESSSIYPTTDVLHQAGPPPAPPQGRAFSTTPPTAPSARVLHQLGSSISSFSTAPPDMDSWSGYNTVVSAVNHLGTQLTPPPASEVTL